MIAVFLYMSCYDVTVLHCYTFVRRFQKLFQHFKKALHLLKKSEGVFCNTPSLEYRIRQLLF